MSKSDSIPPDEVAAREVERHFRDLAEQFPQLRGMLRGMVAQLCEDREGRALVRQVIDLGYERLMAQRGSDPADAACLEQVRTVLLRAVTKVAEPASPPRASGT